MSEQITCIQQVILLPLENGLDGIGVDESRKVSVRDLGSWKFEVGLLSRWFPCGAIDGVQLLESSLGPDAESR